MHSARIQHPAIYSDKIPNAELRSLLESDLFDPNSNHNGLNAFHMVGKCPNKIMYERIQLLFSHGVNINSIEKVVGNGNTPLHTFVAHERFEGLKFLIEEAKKHSIKINYNLQDNEGKNCLILAAKMRQENIALYLLEQADDPSFNVNLADKNKMTALHYACAFGMSQLATALCKKGADLSLKNNNNQLAIDCTEMDENEISAILKSVSIEPTRDEFAVMNKISDSHNQELLGVINGKPFASGHMNLASIKANKPIVEGILKECIFDAYSLYEIQFMNPKPGAEEALQYCSKRPMQQSEKDFILHQFDVMSGVSCVKAAKRDQQKVRNILIDNGADYSWLIRNYAAKNDMQLACILELPSIHQYINLAGQPSGKTALHQAAAKGHASVCEKLIAKGADKDAVDADGNTPIMLACLGKKSKAMLALAEMGASVAIKNKREKTIFNLLNDTKQDALIAPLTEMVNKRVNVVNPDATCTFGI